MRTSFTITSSRLGAGGITFNKWEIPNVQIPPKFIRALQVSFTCTIFGCHIASVHSLHLIMYMRMHWNVSIGPEKLPIFGRFLTLFPLKRPARREKIPPIWRRPSVTSSVHVCVLSWDFFSHLMKTQ
jgi:hypothetical protein